MVGKAISRRFENGTKCADKKLREAISQAEITSRLKPTEPTTNSEAARPTRAELSGGYRGLKAGTIPRRDAIQ